MDTFLLYFFSIGLLASSLKTILSSNPAYSALYLAVSMILLSFVFFLMSAPFIAGLQLIIYAGAVIVLFVMVLMLFDLKKEGEAFFNRKAWIWPCFLFGLFAGLTVLSSLSNMPQPGDLTFFTAKPIALRLFTKYLFIFELIGLLLLVVAIAVVALSRLDSKD